MAILKHIASKNADYGEIQRYLMFEHFSERAVSRRASPLHETAENGKGNTSLAEKQPQDSFIKSLRLL
jgi:hypothetical protein